MASTVQTFLDVVADEKRLEVAERSQQISEAELWEQVSELSPRASFQRALQRQPGAPISFITELKAKAPGRENVGSLEPEAVIADYEAGGASAVSVLTDDKHFGGSLETLARAGRATDLPLLHKEFIIDPYQLLEGRVRGASAALILSYYFTQSELAKIIDAAHRVGVEAVVECSLEDELPRTLAVNPDIILINNRPIAAIPADPREAYSRGSVDNAGRWWQQFDDLRHWKESGEKLLISASCVDGPQDVGAIASFPYDAILVGNAAMVAADRTAFVQGLIDAGS
jgi:indole-3-glycerol phosphate synthase